MTFLEKQKVKSRLTIAAFAMFGLFIGWISDASALPSYYADFSGSPNFNVGSNAGIVGSSCTTCHDATVPTCSGCHAHGSHSNGGKDDINITATTDKSTYSTTETITITIDGGYEPGGVVDPNWIRVTIDEGSNELDISSGPCDAPGDPDLNCGGGNGFPITFTVPAIDLGTGAHILTASWYGHMFDLENPTRGDGTNGSTFIDDNDNNPGHGFETVAITSFTIDDAPPASSGGGGGSLSWPALGLLLFVVTGMLLRGQQANLIPIKQRTID